MIRATLVLCLLATPAYAGRDTHTVKARARVIDPTVYGMTMEEWNQIGIVNSPTWKTKQCCMTELYNRTHERQVSHEYCNDNQIVEWIGDGICEVLI
jgi:hypothetical protein